jgi:hypothetical protein
LRRFAIAGLIALAAALGTSAAIPAARAALDGSPATVGISTASAASAVPATGTLPGVLARMRAPGGPLAGARPAIAAAPAASMAPWYFFTGVSCIGVNDCLAVGGNNNGAGGHGTPLASLWNGSTWRNTPLHLPSGATAAFLYGVSCKAGGCVAVGYYRKGSAAFPLAQFWKGGTWSLGKLPALPSGGINSALQAISCLSMKFCVATGSYSPAGNPKNLIGLAEYWNGSGWKAYRPPTPATTFSYLDTVSCVRTTYCLAGGAYYTSNNAPALAELWTGGAWHRVAVPQPTTAAGVVSEIDGLSCTSTTTCTLTGDTNVFHSDGTVTMSTFAEVQAAGTWSLTPVPMPAGQQSFLNWVSCTSATNCVASGGVGPYTNSWTQGHAAVATWNGSAWAVRVITPPSGQGSVLWADTCAAPASCVAVGTVGKFGTRSGFALTGIWNGATWKMINTT